MGRSGYAARRLRMGRPMSASPPVQPADPAVRSVICVHRKFERSWPYTADHWHNRWGRSGGCELIRTDAEDANPAQLVPDPASVRRVLNDELALAADVFEEEPLPLDSPLLGRHNVVHTPHAAGRTRDANHAFADDAISRFKPR